MSSTPQGPFKLITVNTAPERAKRLIGRVVEALKDRYTIIHVENVEKIADVQSAVERNEPDMLVGLAPRGVLTRRGMLTRDNTKKLCASMWTPEESARIQRIAREARPGIKTKALPHGLQVERGPEAVVEWLMERVPALIES